MKRYRVPVRDTVSGSLGEDLLLRQRKLAAEVGRIPEERRQGAVRVLKHRIDVEKLELAESVRPAFRIAVQHDRAARRLERIDMRAAGEVWETERFGRLPESARQIFQWRASATPFDERLRIGRT